ncbi:MAG: hypothetical protein IJO83_03435 [Clostridia bacterium]|nr:hypothetical protein [Clostridia bacterium]
MKKRLLSILLVVVMVMGIMPGFGIMVSAADAVSYIDCYWDSENKTLVTLTKQVEEYTVLTAENVQILTDGWYVLKSTFEVDERIEVNGDVHIVLSDYMTLNAFSGIRVPEGTALHIYAQSANEETMGQMFAYYIEKSAAIGGNYKENFGTIVINGGKITARGHHNASAIGGSYQGNGESITINGGIIDGESLGYAGVIGAGNEGNLEALTINGGKIRAFCYVNGTGIGACGGRADVTINGGTIDASAERGAGISSEIVNINGGEINASTTKSGGEGISGKVTITGGNVTANGSLSYAGIEGEIIVLGGTVEACIYGDVTIKDGTVTATGVTMAAIGGGNITIEGGTVIATSTLDCAAIGGVADYDGGNITISGGNVTAVCEGRGAGIGGGSYGNGGNIVISGGTVTATSKYGAGIGGGDEGGAGNILITGGTITATNELYSAGIGSGQEGVGGAIAITGGSVTATGGERGAGIGSGYYAKDCSVTILGGEIEATGGSFAENILSGQMSENCSLMTVENGEIVITGNHTINCDYTITAEQTLKVAEGLSFTIAEGVTLTNNGTVVCEGPLYVKGEFINNGETDCSYHTYQVDCDTTCDICQSVRLPEKHTYAEATCQVAPKCIYCDFEEGDKDPSNHEGSLSDDGFYSCCGAFQSCYKNPSYGGAYVVHNAGQLFWVAQQINNDIHNADGDGDKSFIDAHVIIGRDIDLGGRPWTPIGALYTVEDTIGNAYKGVFDGKNYTISNIYIEATTGDVGFFGEVRGATIKNTELEGEIVIKKDNIGYIGTIGAVCGENDGSAESLISGVTSHINISVDESVDLTSLKYIGGIAGYTNQNPTFENCVWDGKIDLGNVYTDSVGGIVGHTYGAKTTITDCAAYGTIECRDDLLTGGIAGSVRKGTSTYTNCVTTQKSLYGALNGDETVTNCYYLSDTETEDGGKTEEQFASGEVAYLLGDEWGQKIGVEAYPILGGETVYYEDGIYYNDVITLGTDNGDGTYSLPEGVVGYYIDDTFVDAGKYPVTDGAVITTVYFNVTMVNGAQVRFGDGLDENGKIKSGNGLRFLAQVDRSDFDGIGYGMRITTEGSESFTEVDAEKWQDDTTFTVALTNMAEGNYIRNFTATPYVVVKYDDGTEKTVYRKDSVTRSIYQVASGLLKDETQTATSLINVLNAYANQTGIRLVLKDGELKANTSYTEKGAYKLTEDELHFTVSDAEYDKAGNKYSVILTAEGNAQIITDNNFWYDYIRINNNNSLVKDKITIERVEGNEKAVKVTFAADGLIERSADKNDNTAPDNAGDDFDGESEF